MISISDDINTFFQNSTNCGVPNRPFFFSALIIAMQDPSFDYEKKQTIEQINNEIYRVVKEKLVCRINNSVNKFNATARYSFLENINIIDNIDSNKKTKTSKIFRYDVKLTPEDNYKNFIKIFFEKYGGFNETLKYYDVIGKAYTNFLKYTKAAGGQDIVLTPDHIKHLMFDIIKVDKDDVILDTCTGSGGFIATGFGKLLEANKKAGYNIETGSERFKHITENQLVAIENEPDMYTLAFSNMILHGDGKSNLYEGNCFDKKYDGIIKKLKPTLGIINPPYNDDAAPPFMLRLLNLLEKRGKAIVIAPSNCLTQDIDTAEKILKYHSLKAIIKLNNKIFISQKVNIQTSLYIFEAGVPYDGDNIYFYNFEDDSYYYSARKEYENDFEERKKIMIENYRDKKIIDGISYFEKFDGDYNKLQYIAKTKDDLTYNDFIDALIDYTMFELWEAKNV